MNTLQLVLKNMRQRALSTTLTLLSVILGVALAVGIMILRRESKDLFAQTDFGYELIVGPAKGSPLQLTLNTVYHMDQSPGLVPYSVYEDLSRKTPAPAGKADYRQFVKQAVPIVVGDSVEGRRLVGTTPLMFGHDDEGKPVEGDKFEYRKGKSYTFAQGRVFAAKKFEAVIGADVARDLGYHVYDPNKSETENLKTGGAFRVTHGIPQPGETPDVHEPRWRIVGILEPTGTANDRVVFVPFISLYAIAEHEDGMIEQALLRAKVNPLRLPPDQREAAIQALGIDTAKLSTDLKQKFGLIAPPTRPAGPTGDLMSDIKPEPAHDDHAHDDHAHDDHGHDTAAKDDHGHEDHDDHAGHDHGEDAFTLDADGNIVPNLPQSEWTISAILVRARGGDTAGFATTMMLYNFKVIDERATAVSPAATMREFFDTFLKGSTNVLLAISVLVTVVAGASITTTIYNSVSARLREIAILRALGATRGKILALICSEAMLIGLIGGIVGLLVGHALSGVASGYFRRTVGEDINWLKVGGEEIGYLAAVVLLSLIAGLVPALKAYRTPVATNLSAG